MLPTFLLSLALAAQIRYTNPVIEGDFPDPSVIRVDDRTQRKLHIDPYWAVTTGGSDVDGAMPLFHASDLVHWQRADRRFVFAVPPSWAQKDYWAPEISESPDGEFYIFYAAFCNAADPTCPKDADHRNNPRCIGVAESDFPGGPYVDAGKPIICDQWGSIDAMAYWDHASAKQYLLWKEDANDCKCNKKTRIFGQEFFIRKGQPSSFRFAGIPKCLLKNDNAWEGDVVEAPFLLKHGDNFYLFYAGAACCGPADCNYAEGVARARTPLGDYVKDPANPIMKLNAAWKCPGHGSIVTLPDCHTFLLHHAYRANATENIRNAVLDEVKWNAGWPVINNNQGVVSEGAVPSPDSNHHGACPEP
jgi:xylan 1,4-beta-xylosidase